MKTTVVQIKNIQNKFKFDTRYSQKLFLKRVSFAYQSTSSIDLNIGLAEAENKMKSFGIFLLVSFIILFFYEISWSEAYSGDILVQSQILRILRKNNSTF